MMRDDDEGSGGENELVRIEGIVFVGDRTKFAENCRSVMVLF